MARYNFGLGKIAKLILGLGAMATVVSGNTSDYFEGDMEYLKDMEPYDIVFPVSDNEELLGQLRVILPDHVAQLVAMYAGTEGEIKLPKKLAYVVARHLQRKLLSDLPRDAASDLAFYPGTSPFPHYLLAPIVDYLNNKYEKHHIEQRIRKLFDDIIYSRVWEPIGVFDWQSVKRRIFEIMGIEDVDTEEQAEAEGSQVEEVVHETNEDDDVASTVASKHDAEEGDAASIAAGDVAGSHLENEEGDAASIAAGDVAGSHLENEEGDAASIAAGDVAGSHLENEEEGSQEEEDDDDDDFSHDDSVCEPQVSILDGSVTSQEDKPHSHIDEDSRKRAKGRLDQIIELLPKGFRDRLKHDGIYELTDYVEFHLAYQRDGKIFDVIIEPLAKHLVTEIMWEHPEHFAGVDEYAARPLLERYIKKLLVKMRLPRLRVSSNVPQKAEGEEPRGSLRATSS
ncbi:uncharacterized protein BXIN_1942 [Babesia sp. Xinjiang]|uniref:uncharacterized protein n=1 Tax=Babesia sp. Xinjiang TaxID=462227 RepID=UPI000A25067B|nr:uncharacterized protein BXIN_1942 [Babesia sp. Xinjiang]ORM40506.1 hypothetical protein BXIN_1942 [Babesia sp. Xinjiang]